MTCWKCGAQTVDNTCTMCGCLQDTRQPAQSPNGKSLRYIYDKLGPAATLTNPTNFIRCLGDIFPDDDDFREKMAQVLQTNVGTHLYTMLSENKNIDEGAHQELMHIVRNKCSLPDEEIRAMLFLLLDMVGCSKGKTVPTSSNANGSASSETERPVESVKPVEIERSSTVSKAPKVNTEPSSKKAFLSIAGLVACVLCLVLLMVYTQHAKNTPAGQTSQKTSASSTSNGYIPAQQAIPYDFTLDGATYTLPCPVSQLLANGWQIYTYEKNHGATYFSANDPVAPGEFGASPVSSVSTYIYKGSPGDYSWDGSYQLAPDSDCPCLAVTINNVNSSTSVLKDCYITEIAAFDFLEKNNFSFTWNGISLDSAFSVSKSKVDTLKRRCEPVTYFSDSDDYAGFGIETALEKYDIFIQSSSDKLVDYIQLSHYITPK